MKRTARLASLALVGTLALTACGNDDGDDTGANAGDPADLTSQTTDEGGDEPTAEDPSGAAPEGEQVDVDQFVSDMEEGVDAMTTAHMTMDMDLGGQAMKGEGDISYEDGYAADLSLTVPGIGSMRMIMVEPVIYLKSAQLGPKFIKMDLSDPRGPLGPMAEMFEGMDPATQLQQFEEGITSVTLVGEETVQGEEMRHYVIALDPTRMKQFRGQPGVAELGEVEYDAWLDDEHRLRQVEMALPGQGSMRTSITDLGKDVDIEAPPASQVASAPKG